MKFKDIIVVIPDGATCQMDGEEASMYFENCSFVTEIGIRNGVLSGFLGRCGVSNPIEIAPARGAGGDH
jgi:hypothetical protein